MVCRLWFLIKVSENKNRKNVERLDFLEHFQNLSFSIFGPTETPHYQITGVELRLNAIENAEIMINSVSVASASAQIKFPLRATIPAGLNQRYTITQTL